MLDLSEDGLNFPNTCTAMNTCPGSIGGAAPSYDLHGLVELIADLGAE